jgi:hypothetical protein
LVERVVHSLACRTREGLSCGAALSGKGWRVDREGLHCKVGGKPVIYPLACLSYAGRHAVHLCIWKGEEERPFLRIPSWSRNAYPLGVFLQEAILANPARVVGLPGKPLGRLLLKLHNPDRGKGLFVAPGFLLLALFFGAMGITSESLIAQFGLLVLAALTLCLVPISIFQFVQSDRPTIQFHEAGVSQPGPEGEHELLYTDVETMIWKRGKEILFASAAGSERPVIHYRSAHGQQSAELIGYRDQAASIIARRWLAELEKGPVTWLPRLRFLPDGLEYRPEVMLGSGSPRMVPYDKIRSRFQQGVFELFVEGKTGAVLRERSDGINFFPGLMLLNWMCSGKPPAEAEAGSKTPDPRPERMPSSPDVRITATGGPSSAVTAEMPEGGDEEDDE